MLQMGQGRDDVLVMIQIPEGLCQEALLFKQPAMLYNLRWISTAC